MKKNSPDFGNNVLNKGFSILLQKPITEFDNTLDYHLYINIDSPSYIEETKYIDLTSLETSPVNTVNEIREGNGLNNLKIDFSKSYFPVYNRYYKSDYDDSCIKNIDNVFLLGSSVAKIAKSQSININKIIFDFDTKEEVIYRVDTDGSLFDAIQAATFTKNSAQLIDLESYGVEKDDIIIDQKWKDALLQIKDPKLRAHFSLFCVTAETARYAGFWNSLNDNYASALEPITNIGKRIIEWTTTETLSPTIGIFQMNNNHNK